MELFRLLGTVAVENSGANAAIDETTDKAEKSESRIGSAFGKIGEAAVNLGKVMATGLAVGATAVAGLAKSALDSYADYEQLKGGVETLFGAGGQSLEEYAKSVGKSVEEAKSEYEGLLKSQNIVMENASKAYINAGMSANEYMEQVTSFAASLIQSTSRGAQTNLAELEATLDSQYEATKRACEDEYDALKASWKKKIELAKQYYGSNNTDYLEEQRDAELKALKRSNEDMLKELKAYNAEQIAQAEAANNISNVTAESTAKAAEKANQAIIDMSDNANKMGTAMESIQNAYNGFAKQNYTMLDNLKLGYGGTKEEMQRLLSDAQAISGVEYDISSYADVVDAIHVIQEKMGITKTTEKEAFKTITGSIKTMKSAFSNLVTGLGREDVDLSGLVDQFIISLSTVADNVMPRLQIILDGIAEAFNLLIPKISEKLPELMNTLLPPLINSAGQLIAGLASALPGILQILLEQLPGILTQIGQALSAAFPALLETVKTLFGQIWDYISLELLDTGVSFEDATTKIKEIFTNTWNVIQEKWEQYGQPIFDKVKAVFSNLYENADGIFGSVSEKFSFLWGICQEIWSVAKQNVFDNISMVLDFLRENWETIIGTLSTLFEVLWDVCLTVWETIGQPIFDIIQSAIGKVREIFEENMPKILTVFSEVVDTISEVWETILKPVFEAVGQYITDELKPSFETTFDLISTIVSDAFDLIRAAWDEVLKPLFDGICDFVEKAFADDWEGAWQGIVDTFDTVFGGLVEVAKKPINGLIELVNNAISNINDAFGSDISLISELKEEGSVQKVDNSAFATKFATEGLPEKVPKMAKGGVLERGQIGLLEGDGTEAVVPLEQNTEWISRVAQQFNGISGNDVLLQKILEVLQRNVEVLTELKESLPEELADSVAQLKFEVSNREFARLVKAVN